MAQRCSPNANVPYANGTIVGPTYACYLIVCARKSFVRAHACAPISARQIAQRVGVISRAGRWLRKLVVSRENGYIQKGNDPTASHLLLTISVCTKIFVRAPECTQKSARQIRRRVGAISRAARQIRRRVGVISRAGRWLRKVVVSHENGYIQA